MSVLFFLQGSQTGNLGKPATNSHPFEPCPDSPNCIIHSADFPTEAEKLFEKSLDVLQSMNPYRLDSRLQSLQIDAVFRIALFGFKDDLSVLFSQKDGQSILYVKSSSREGYSDLGVNRRRVRRFLKKLNSTLTT